jgi:adenylylsulfate kinase-like enzyme
MTIVRLNGTHGSGKSTVARRILKKFPHSVVWSKDGKKHEGYRVHLPGGKVLHIVGPYQNPCGGCDAVQPFSRIWPLVEHAADDFKVDHVFFEGALVSTTYGSIGAASEVFEDGQFVFAFLDTPLEVCVERVNQRRAERGQANIEDIRNIESKWFTIERLRVKLETGVVGTNQKVAVIDHNEATKQVLALMGVRIQKEPT